MFVDEDQWRRAFEAAKNEVDLLIASGEMTVPDTWGNLAKTGLAHRIASAALRAAAQDDEGDIGDVAGVRIDEIRNHTRSNDGDAAKGYPKSELSDE